MERFTKYKFILLTALLINTILVATHQGEFWPFSIFPMFSQAGNAWSRGVVQTIDNKIEPSIWDKRNLAEIEDQVLSLDSIGVDAIDYANFISKTKEWNPKRIKALRDLLDIDEYPESKWMITIVNGYLAEKDSVVVEATPLFLFTEDTTYRNPHIFSNYQ